MVDETREVRGTCPMDCPDTCSWIVTVRGDKLVRLRGDADHPVTRGVLCAKMNEYIQYTQHPGRLMHPLRRVGAKGEGRFERLSWDEAITEIGDRWVRIREEFGGEAIWPYYGDGSFGLLQGVHGAGRRLFNAIGASKHGMTICTIAGGVGTHYTIGDRKVGMDPETLRYSKLIILWGTNTLTTNHHLWRTVIAARENGAKLVVIDPVRTRTATEADQHIAPRPGTDAALALGVMNIVLRMGAQDDDFIEHHTLGWDKFRARILEFDPARVASITGLPVEVVEGLGVDVATRRPTGIKTAMGVQRHGGGGMAVRTITCIPGVTGDWRVPGGGAVYDTRGWFKGNWAALYRDDLCKPGVRTLSMTRMGETLLGAKDPPVKSICIYASNPLASAPHLERMKRGLAREDLFTVVLEHFHTDTSAYADIILPATAQLEHKDLHIAYGHIYVSWNEPAVAPPGECLPTSEIFRRIARSMGLKESALYEGDEDMARQVLDTADPALQGITLERLKEKGWLRLNYPRTEEFAPFANGFLTPSGKLEFYSETMARDGLDPLAGYTPPCEAGDDDPLAAKYPFCLIAGAKHFFLNSIFANSPRHVRREEEGVIVLHPADAEARGLSEGSVCRVFNDRGEFQAVVATRETVRRGVISTTKGSWPGRMPGRSWVNATVPERDSDMGGGATFHDNRVQVERLPL